MYILWARTVVPWIVPSFAIRISVPTNSREAVCVAASADAGLSEDGSCDDRQGVVDDLHCAMKKMQGKLRLLCFSGERKSAG